MTMEYAILMANGDMQIRNPDPEVDRIFPLADWIKSRQRFGGKIYRRTIYVVENWEEVPR